MSRKVSAIQPAENAVLIPLAKLTPGRHNPRRVKPERDAHRRLVASIRAHGLLQPLIVRLDEAAPGSYRVTAGNRRLAALREVYKKEDETRAPCIVRADEDDDAARAVALAENFAREPMHPLDEATAFARLAREDGQNAEQIAADFGVTPAYVRQRMKLAALSDLVQIAYRTGTIDTATAEAFATVPPERQDAIWAEMDGQPQHAHHVRNVIAHGWIDAQHALFDVSTLPDWTISRDLFGQRVLIERSAFVAAQSEALERERQRLLDEGWREVVAGVADAVRDRLWSMNDAPHGYDPHTERKLAKLQQRRQKLESKLEKIDENDQPALDAIGAKLDAVDAAEQGAREAGHVQYTENTKAVGTVFLLMDPDGRVRREYRVPRPGRGNSNGSVHGSTGSDGTGPAEPKPLTSDDLREAQLGTTFTHQALGVRQALLGNTVARRRVLALLLHEKVRGEAIAIRHDANGTTLHAEHAEGFASAALDALRQRRAELDPLTDRLRVDDAEAYAVLSAVPEAQVEQLIDLLTVECITAHLQRPTALVVRLAAELNVNVRSTWRPDAQWLAGYQKIQLVHLVYELRGPAYGPAAERKKKSELVADLSQLFADAAEGRLEDPSLAERINAWLPANLRERPATSDDGRAAA